MKFTNKTASLLLLFLTIGVTTDIQQLRPVQWNETSITAT